MYITFNLTNLLSNINLAVSELQIHSHSQRINSDTLIDIVDAIILNNFYTWIILYIKIYFILMINILKYMILFIYIFCMFI